MAGGILEAQGKIMTVEAKKELRSAMRQELKRMSTDFWRQRSAEAVGLLQQQLPWLGTRRVMGYCALAQELDLWPALAAGERAGKEIMFPRYDAVSRQYVAAASVVDLSTFTRAGFGVFEPSSTAPVVPLNQLDFVLVPGLAFDRSGRRLGRGKGFYDRLLAQVNGVKCGVSLDEQLVEELPAEPHDIAMNFILTPTRWLVVPPART